ncbi:MAG TPA: hypothetical protein VKX17_01250 [Planctomycetota bacterium]|nr:hypothetical protein [Planctomycetota bacterium]
MPEPPRRKRFQVRLSTAIVLMFAAGACIYLNTLPILHYAGEISGKEIFEISGYGWPCRVWDTGLFYGPFRNPSWEWTAILFNVFFAALIAGWVIMLCEWRHYASLTLKRGVFWGTLLGLILGCLWFCMVAFIALMPVISPVSFSIVYKPWWQNWRSATVVAAFVALIVIIIKLARGRLRTD